MRTKVINAEHPQAIQQAVELLRSGGLVAFPTDTVYGLGALAFHAAAVKKIYIAKDRPDEKAIPVLIADPADLEKVAGEASPLAAALAAHFWPGPLTLVVPRHPDLPAEISIYPTVGVRIPDHSLARRLLKITGPMAVTSANRSSGPSPVTAAQVYEQMNGRIELILDGGTTRGGIPSTVVDCVGAEPLVLREGPISRAEIVKVLGGEL